MAKFNKKQPVSEEVVNDALGMAKATQKPGQTKEQTKLIAQGIQKGIEQYKKQHKVKVRQQDKLRKNRQEPSAEAVAEEPIVVSNTISWTPWVLLGLSWLGFALTIWLKPGA